MQIEPKSIAPPKYNWFTIIAMGLFHVGAVGALFFYDVKAILVAAALYWAAICLGIGMCYHRLLTHRSYVVPKFVEYFMSVCGTLALEGGPIFWVATHRVHHQYSDQEGDPHSPVVRDGYWAHVGWIIFGEANHRNTQRMSRYAPDLAKDPFHVWLNNYHWVPMVVLGVALLTLGGISYLMWGIFARVVIGLHATWLVNSATHMWGTRRFATRDDSRNSWWVALLTFGEGWHNNHHAHPTSARHGLAWYELDISWIHIRALQLLGIARHVRVARVTAPVVEESEAAA